MHDKRKSQMPRRFARIVFAVAAAGVVGGLVAGCGDDDATATSTPSASTSASSEPSASGTVAPSATTNPGPAATAPPETPAPVPSDFPGGTQAPATNEKDAAFIAELGDNGVTPTPEIATAIGGYICRALQEGSTPDEMNTFVVAMVGGDQESTQLSPEDAARVYIDAAKKTYC